LVFSPRISPFATGSAICVDLTHSYEMGEVDFNRTAIAAGPTAPTTATATGEVLRPVAVPREVLRAANVRGAGSVIAVFAAITVSVDHTLVVQAKSVDLDVSASMTAVATTAAIPSIRIHVITEQVRTEPPCAAATTAATAAGAPVSRATLRGIFSV
jgi:hypothetical protein